jgi:hypothetical protein
MAIELSDKVKSLVAKLLELSNRGIGGEAKNAERLLQNLLAKHGITLEDLDNNAKRKCGYYIKPKHKRLFFAICWNVIPNWSGTYTISKANRMYIGLELDLATELELTSKFDHYVVDYDMQRRALMQNYTKAYIFAQNGLATHPTNTSDPNSVAKLTSKQLAEILAASELAKSIIDNPYLKQIE